MQDIIPVKTLIVITMIAHYLTDSFNVGWGIRWLYPFSNRYFAYRSIDGKIKQFHAWTPAEQNEIAAQLGNPNWAKEIKRWNSDITILSVAIVVTVLWYVL